MQFTNSKLVITNTADISSPGKNLLIRTEHWDVEVVKPCTLLHVRTSEPCKVMGWLVGVGGPHVELTVLQVARDLQELNCVRV